MMFLTRTLYAICLAVLAICITPTLHAAKNPKKETNEAPAPNRARKTGRIFLKSPLLAFADGKEIGMPPAYIGFMMQIVRELSRMQDGKEDKDGKLIGMFTFQGKPHSIRSLHKIEAEADLLWCELQQDLPAGASAQTHEERKKKIAAHKKTLNDLQQSLQLARDHFIAKILPFNEHARGVKEILLSLAQEECTERNNDPDSFLLLWSDCPEGKEAETMNRDVVSFKIFDLFLTDLIDFLNDIIYSCPKARAGFLEIVKQKMNNGRK